MVSDVKKPSSYSVKCFSQIQKHKIPHLRKHRINKKYCMCTFTL